MHRYSAACQVPGTRDLHNNHPQVKHQHQHHYQLSTSTGRSLSLVAVVVVVAAASGCSGGVGHIRYRLLLLGAASLEKKTTRYQVLEIINDKQHDVFNVPQWRLSCPTIYTLRGQGQCIRKTLLGHMERYFSPPMPCRP